MATGRITEQAVYDPSTFQYSAELRGPDVKKEATEAPRSEREQILRTALDLTTGDRNKTYGDPLDSMQCYADLFNAYLLNKYGEEGADGLTAHDIAVFMVLVKIGRVAVSPHHRDNYVDGAAYLAIAGEVVERNGS